MYIGTDNYFDLTYCSNIHAGGCWNEVFANMQTFLPPLKEKYAPNKPFALGLRLSNQTIEDLLLNDTLRELKEWLQSNQFYIMTVNAFPYGNFHKNAVKDNVYSPDWRTHDRRDYSLKVTQVLAALTPEGAECGFSTSPLSYKPWLNEKTINEAFYLSAIHLSEVAINMATIYEHTGTLIHIDIEPEPDCLIETSEELVCFFQKWLIPIGTDYMVKHHQLSPQQAEVNLRRHVQACYDICHASVEFEEPEQVFKNFNNAGIAIGKIQISAALAFKTDKNSLHADDFKKNLQAFIDPIYLHQVICRSAHNQLSHQLDLSEYFLNHMAPDVEELRTHFHIPLFLDHYEQIQSTQKDICKVLELVKKNKLTKHLEIETYTWDVLPPNMKLDVLSSIEREYDWVLAQF